MLQSGILNPQLLSLLARVRHTNTLAIADWAFPSWPGIETVDLSLTHGVPTVCQVLRAIRANFQVQRVYLAEEFRQHNSPAVQQQFLADLTGLEIVFEPHERFKTRVPHVTGLVRTGDETLYSNLVLESG